MILYNVTVNVQQEIESQWLDWMKSIHIPKVLETGCFESNKFFKLLLEDQSGGTNYSVQYFATDMAQLERYLNLFAEKLRDEHEAMFKGKVVAFRTVLEEIT